MCGILGVVSRFATKNRDWLVDGCFAMSHRGPDDAGVWWSDNGRVGFAHRRLSIIDLSSAGHQPMTTADGKFTIVFNGEIYNFSDLRAELESKGHVFQSRSDTEVILAAYREWGAESVTRLNGMFAFAIYDGMAQTLFLARDRAGEKPLYYSLNDHEIRFASEIKGLLADPVFPRQIDPKALDCYLAMGVVPGESCILRGVKKIPPAHVLVYDIVKGTVRVRRYWRLPELDEKSCYEIMDQETMVGKLESLLENAVCRQLVSDVPIGILLSGGIDSSLVTAMAVRAIGGVKTFTVRLPNDGKYDETEHARLIARYFHTEHIELDASDISPDIVSLLACQFDEPIVDSSMVPTFLVSKLVRQYCVVALGGDGGDELFGGYAHYNRLLAMHKCNLFVPAAVRMLAARWSESVLPIGFRGRNILQEFKYDLNNSLPVNAKLFDRAMRVRLLGQNIIPSVAENFFAQRIPSVRSLLDRATRMDFENYLPEGILTKVDRASMLNSLEIRAPFLDHRIIEFAFGCVPPQFKATNTKRKILLKKLARRLLPAEFDLERKQGFSIPLGKWLNHGSWYECFHDVLLDSKCIFSKTAVIDLFNAPERRCKNSERLFSLVLFELWRQHYKVQM